MADSATPRVCVIIPAHGGDAALAGLVKAVREHAPDVIVVNDGPEESSAELRGISPPLELISLPSRQGKGAALLAGYERALACGFTHAITVDSDGEHRPDDLPAFLQSIRERPEAIAVGVRDLAHARRAKRLLRWNFNLWTRFATGRRFPDTQCGFRAVPLSVATGLILRKRGFSHESELLIKAVWAGVDVIPVPVGVGEAQRPALYRPFHDSKMCTHEIAMLVWRRLLLPPTLRRAIYSRAVRDQSLRDHLTNAVRRGLDSERETPRTLAAAVVIGTTCRLLPFWGFHLRVARGLANWLGLDARVARAAGDVSFAFFIPILILISHPIGQLILTGRVVIPLEPSFLSLDAFGLSLLEYLIGTAVLSVVVGAVAATVVIRTGRAVLRDSHRGDRCGRVPSPDA